MAVVVTVFGESERVGPYAGFVQGLESEIFSTLQRAEETWAVRDPGGGGIPETELRVLRLEGFVDFVNRNLLVTVRLVEPATGRILWEDRHADARIQDEFQYRVRLGREIGTDVVRQVRQRGR